MLIGVDGGGAARVHYHENIDFSFFRSPAFKEPLSYLVDKQLLHVVSFRFSYLIGHVNERIVVFLLMQFLYSPSIDFARSRQGRRGRGALPWRGRMSL